jgi:hypothetical protein
MSPVRFWLRLALAVVSVFAALAARSAPEPARSYLVGKVWSGHPVGFAFLTYGDRQFIAYYDETRRLTVAAHRLGSDEWTYAHPEGQTLAARQRDSNMTGWDSHNALALALDSAGCLHLAGNMHDDPLLYWRTRQPLDIATFERLDRMTGENESACSFPVFFHDAAGDLFFRYREGSDSAGHDFLNRYDPATHAWRRLFDTPLLDGEGRHSARALDPVLGPDGRFHLVWLWRDSSDSATFHTLSYARSADLIHWEDHHGAPLALPLTPARGDVIDPAPPQSGLIDLTCRLSFDATQRPVVVYHRYDASGRSQVFAARPEGDAWLARPLSEWVFRWRFQGSGSIATEVQLGQPRLAPDGFLLMPFAADKAGVGRWQVRLKDLKVVSELSSAPAPLPPFLLKPHSTYPGMKVNTIIQRVGATCYLLRWETLPRNRDQPRREATPPSELRLYEIADPVGELVDYLDSPP